MGRDGSRGWQAHLRSDCVYTFWLVGEDTGRKGRVLEVDDDTVWIQEVSQSHLPGDVPRDGPEYVERSQTRYLGLRHLASVRPIGPIDTLNYTEAADGGDN